MVVYKHFYYRYAYIVVALWRYMSRTPIYRPENKEMMEKRILEVEEMIKEIYHKIMIIEIIEAGA